MYIRYTMSILKFTALSYIMLFKKPQIKQSLEDKYGDPGEEHTKGQTRPIQIFQMSDPNGT